MTRPRPQPSTSGAQLRSLGRRHRGGRVRRRSARRGLTLVEVLVALTLVAIQTPAIVATVGAAAALTRRAEVLLASLDDDDLIARCHRS